MKEKCSVGGRGQCERRQLGQQIAAGRSRTLWGVLVSHWGTACTRLSTVLHKPAHRATRLSTVLHKPAHRATRLSTVLHKPAHRATRLSTVLHKPAHRATRLSTVLHKPAHRATRLSPVLHKPAHRAKAGAPKKNQNKRRKIRKVVEKKSQARTDCYTSSHGSLSAGDDGGSPVAGMFRPGQSCTSAEARRHTQPQRVGDCRQEEEQ